MPIHCSNVKFDTYNFDERLVIYNLNLKKILPLHSVVSADRGEAPASKRIPTIGPPIIELLL